MYKFFSLLFFPFFGGDRGKVKDMASHVLAFSGSMCVI